MIVVKIVEIIPDRGKEMALEGCLAVKFQFQYVELNVEQLFKFKPVLCLAEYIRVFREVDVVQSLVQVDQVVFFDEPCWEGFLNPAVDGFENVRLYLVDQPGGQVTFFSSSPWSGRWLGNPRVAWHSFRTGPFPGGRCSSCG